MPIKCIIFDVGGVLIKERIEKVYGEINAELGKKIFDRKDPLHRKILLGQLNEKEFFDLLSKRHKIPAKRLQELSRIKYLKIAKINKDVIKIAKQLNKKYKTCILSNVSIEHKKHGHVMKLYTYFDDRVLSCDIGSAKPDSRKIFLEAMKRLHAKPRECVYIEDREEFLETPRKLGMQVIHFRNAKQLTSELKKFGVKI